MKKYKPGEIKKLIEQNKDRYKQYFDKKTKIYKNYKISYIREYIPKDKDIHKLMITLCPWEISDNKNLSRKNRKKLYKKKHKSGWEICGRVVEDYFLFVPQFFAFHKKFGSIYGNFSKEITLESHFDESRPYDLSYDFVIEDFLENHVPLIWDIWDI